MAHSPEQFHANPAASAAHAQLLILFPHSDPGFVRACIVHWLSCSPPAHPPINSSERLTRSAGWTAQDLVERVSNKLLDIRPSGEWPHAVPPVRPPRAAVVTDSTIANTPQVRSAFSRRTSGKTQARNRDARDEQGSATRDDNTLARNLALVRLHALFPLVPIHELREVVLAQPHSILFGSAETLIDRASLNSKRLPSATFGGDLLEAATDAWARIFGDGGRRLAGTSSSRRQRSGKGKAHIIDAIDQHTDPVLTPHDLFHSPAYESALLGHFQALFPALTFASIEHVVHHVGGSYASMREGLERTAAEVQDEKDRPWWSRWMGARPGRVSRAEASTWSRSGTDPSPSASASARVKAAVHPLIRHEVASFESAQRRPPAQPVSGEASRRVEETSLPLVECQCCFSVVPYSSTQLAGCSEGTTQTTLPVEAPEPSSPPHLFCHDCVKAYVRTFTYGGTALPPVALQAFALPCISTLGSSPCQRVFSRADLVRALDVSTYTALSNRITSVTLESFALFCDSNTSLGVKLLRCPFCPYAELADPEPGPLARVFFPAWTAEPFPPSPSMVLRTLLGIVTLFLLLTGAGVLALLSPARRLERAYAALHPLQDGEIGAAQLRRFSLLGLPEQLLLAPHHLPGLCVAYVRGMADRVLRDREGERARIFRCKNDGRPLGRRFRGSLKPAGERSWLERLESVQEVKWTDLIQDDVSEDGVDRRNEERNGQNEGDVDGEVEERRRDALVRFLWGPKDTDSQPTEVDGSSQPPICGKVSCLLCGGAINPTAPSLHSCRRTSPVAAGADPATEQERAQESLRLVVERMMSDAVKRDCGRCGAALQKETGHGACNKVVCRCGFIYCHYCRHEIPSWQGYGHFCQHPRDPAERLHGSDANGIRSCGKCDKCSLWDEPDEAQRVRDAVEKARVNWATEHPAWAKMVDLDTPIAFEPDSDPVEVYEWIADGFDAVTETVVRWLLS